MSESALLCVLPCASCGAEARGGPPTPPDLAEILRRRGEGCCSLRCRAALVRQQQDGTLIDPVELQAREEAIAREIDPHAVWGEPAELRALWRTYWRRDDDDSRNALAEAYLHLVRRPAEQIAGTLPSWVGIEPDDLLSAGAIGLMQAIKAYDPHRGAKFATYSAPRIRGAIIDHLRAFDGGSRLRRARLAEIATASIELSHALGRPPCDEEIAAHLGRPASYVEELRCCLEANTAKQLDAPFPATASPKGREATIGQALASPTPEPSAPLEERERWAQILRGLDKRERIVLIGLYQEFRTMTEIARDLGKSESWVSVAHKNVLQRLRQRGEAELLDRLPSERHHAPASCAGFPPSQETPIVPTLSDHASPANNGRLAAQTSATANPAPTAPSLIRLIANAGEEELQAIRDRIAEIRRELENLIAFEKTLASRLGKKTAGAVAEKLSDRIRQTIERNGPAKTAELAKAVNEAEGVVRATCKRTAGFRVASDLTVSLAKGGGR